MSANAKAELVVAGVPGLEVPPTLQTRLSTLVLIRWLALVGQTVTVVVSSAALGGLPLVPVALTIAASGALNLWLSFGPGRKGRIGETRAAWHLVFDIVQLAILVALTGGLSNPFVVFLLAPVTVAAATLSVRATAVLAALAVLALSVIARWHMPLPWDGAPLELPPLYLFGAWMALSVGVTSVSLFTWRIAEDSRRIAAAYSESRLALEQERRVAEVGALAAAVAHELNTPLATITLIARDMATELRDGPLEPDISTLLGQAERCRDTLARLTRDGERGQAVECEKVPFPSLVEMAAEPYAEGAPVQVLFDHAGIPAQAAPWIARSPAILHGLGNFIQNAVQFARSRVEIDTSWCPQGALTVRIADDGPGFPPHLQLGEPYQSGRSDSSGSLGLGIFIATTLLVRTGATIRFSNPEEGGAEVLVTWSEGHG